MMREKAFLCGFVLCLCFVAMLLAGQPLQSPAESRLATPLVKLTDKLYQTEHCFFIIADDGKVAWSQWDSVFSDENITNFHNQFLVYFPGEYLMSTITAKELTPNNSPRLSGGWPHFRNTCLYHISNHWILTSAYGVLDHEIGHVWLAHWPQHSTAWGQMCLAYSDDGFQTVKRITGNPQSGFRWESLGNTARNQVNTFSEQDLYIMGMSAICPSIYVLSNPVYNPDGTMGYSKVDEWNKAFIENRYSTRWCPDYRTAPKHFRVAFIYVARDLAEVMDAYQHLESSATFFCNSEVLDIEAYEFEVPFSLNTGFRGSIDGLLADLDGNSTPQLTIPTTYFLSTNGAAAVNFQSTDPGDAPPLITCLNPSGNMTIGADQVTFSRLPHGTHFFTLKAQDAAGKKTFGNFIIDSLYPPGDIDGDGQVNAADHAALASLIAGGIILPPNPPANPDVNSDGLTNVVDLVTILAHPPTAAPLPDQDGPPAS